MKVLKLQILLTNILQIPNCLEKSSELEYALPKHMRCAAHTLNLVATVDANKAVEECSLYKKVSRSAFGKAQELWNKQSR